MKKIIVAVLVSLGCLPAMADSIQFQAQGPTGCFVDTVNIDFQGLKTDLKKYLVNTGKCTNVVIRFGAKEDPTVHFWQLGRGVIYSFSGSADCEGVTSADIQIGFDFAAIATLKLDLTLSNGQTVSKEFSNGPED